MRDDMSVGAVLFLAACGFLVSIGIGAYLGVMVRVFRIFAGLQ